MSWPVEDPPPLKFADVLAILVSSSKPEEFCIRKWSFITKANSTHPHSSAVSMYCFNLISYGKRHHLLVKLEGEEMCLRERSLGFILHE